jgi:hypothetical protein
MHDLASLFFIDSGRPVYTPATAFRSYQILTCAVDCAALHRAKPTEDKIPQRPGMWEENRRSDGRDEEFWYQAEKELNEDFAIEPTPTILPG